MLRPVPILALCAGLVAAQNAVISAPPPSTTLSPGQTFTVKVDRPNSLTDSKEVSVAIGLLSCAGRAPPGTCDGVPSAQLQEMGSVLFAGPYEPVLEPGSGALFQNYTVAVPDGFQTGPAVLSVAHFNLVGALFFPNLEVLQETVVVQ